MTVSLDPLLIDTPAGPVEVDLRRSRRAARLILRALRSERVIEMAVPDGVSRGDAERFARSRTDWLARAVRQFPDPIWVKPGSAIPLRGETCQIVHDQSAPRTPRLVGTTLLVGGPDPDLAAHRLGRWLKAQARGDLTDHVRLFAQHLDVRVTRLAIKDTRTRWGSASSKGGLNFSWRVILAPPWVLRYLAAHEVAHLREMNHSPRFWALVDDLVDDRRAADAWLDRFGADLHAVQLTTD